MNPPDLIVIGLAVQAVALGHGAVQVFYEPRRPRFWFWLPLVLVIAYYVFAAFVPPPSLDRHAHVTAASWANAWRYVVQVAGFALVVEALLYVIYKQKPDLKLVTQAAVLRAERDAARATVDAVKRQYNVAPTVWPPDPPAGGRR